ncbi:Eukaryotic translation initiation factor 6 [Zea mays]|uniref:Eukaryotic translation initiation factor 6 n=1 Tax=Zea mays TaxID=4577 RepID=C0HH65_MAIZE|nr:unknown [Zea mays]ONM03617.1 Eukaryotic translation initiation factor 6 [Zea mays]
MTMLHLRTLTLTRRLRSSLQMCLGSRCLGRLLLEISLWGVTAPSLTGVVWFIPIHPLKTLTSSPRSSKFLLSQEL